MITNPPEYNILQALDLLGPPPEARVEDLGTINVSRQGVSRARILLGLGFSVHSVYFVVCSVHFVCGSLVCGLAARPEDLAAHSHRCP